MAFNGTQSAAATNALIEAQMDYSVFTGADIVAYMGFKRVATLQGITISITREVMPVFVFGNPNPVNFAKGKRAIAGNLVFTQFDRHAILKAASFLLGPGQVNYIGDLTSFIDPTNANINLGVEGLATVTGNGFPTPINVNTNPAFASALAQEVAETYALTASKRLKFADQVPPFDVTITMVNEEGQASFMAVHGVQIVNEGAGWTIDDMNSEVGFTFVAKDITPLDTLMKGDGTLLNTSQNPFAGQ